MIRINAWLNFSHFTNHGGGLKKTQLHHVQPVRITEGNRLGFFPKALWRSQLATRTEPIEVSPARWGGFKKAVTVTLPQIDKLEAFAAFVETEIGGDVGKDVGKLVRGGLSLLLYTDRPSMLPSTAQADLFAIAEATGRGIVYAPNSTKDKGYYFLIERSDIPQDNRGLAAKVSYCGKVMVVPIFESAAALAQALKLDSPQDTAGAQAPANGAAAATVDATARRQLGLPQAGADPTGETEEGGRTRAVVAPVIIPNEVVAQILAEPLPATARTGGEVGGHLIGANVAAISHVGKKRTANEDGYVITKDGLYVVCDGMGGHSAGEVASAMTLKIIHGGHKQSIPLGASIELAAEKVKQVAAADVKKKGMGTTVVAFKIVDDEVEIAHIGDSRVYFVNNKGEVGLLTNDHSLRGDLARVILEFGPESDQAQIYKGAYEATFDATTPWVTELIARFSGRSLDETLFNDDLIALEHILEQIPKGNIILRAIGHSKVSTPTTSRYQLAPGEWLMACSDGVNGELKGDLVSLLNHLKTSGATIAEAAEAIKGAVLTLTKASDNLTIILYEHPAPAEEPTHNIPILAVHLGNPDKAELATLLDKIINGEENIPIGSEDEIIIALTDVMSKHKGDLAIYNRARTAQDVVLSLAELV